MVKKKINKHEIPQWVLHNVLPSMLGGTKTCSTLKTDQQTDIPLSYVPCITFKLCGDVLILLLFLC